MGTGAVGAVLPARRTDRGGAPFLTRALRPEDRPALEAFYRTFRPKRAAQGLPPDRADRISRWLDATLPRGLHLLVEGEGEVIGHALLVPMPGGSAEYAIWLRHDVRNRGIGTEVNRVAVAAAREAGFSRLWLSVESGNRAAIRSYQRAGFRFLPGTVYSTEVQMERVVDDGE